MKAYQESQREETRSTVKLSLLLSLVNTQEIILVDAVSMARLLETANNVEKRRSLELKLGT